MAITSKELMQAPKFEGLGKYVYCRAGNGDWAPTYTFEFFGGQVSVEVEESEVLNPPVVGSMFFISGHVRRSNRNGSITLAATDKKFIVADSDLLSSEQTHQYCRGLLITGVGVIEDKQSAQIGRSPAFLSATLKWQGVTHQFKKLTPEMYQKIPSPGSYVRFQLGMLVREERNADGQMVVLQMPSLVSVQLDKLETGSVASASASAVPGSGVSLGKPAAQSAPAKV